MTSMKCSKKQFLYLLVLFGLFPEFVNAQNSAADTDSAFVRKSVDIRRTTLEPNMMVC